MPRMKDHILSRRSRNGHNVMHIDSCSKTLTYHYLCPIQIGVGYFKRFKTTLKSRFSLYLTTSIPGIYKTTTPTRQAVFIYSLNQFFLGLPFGQTQQLASRTANRKE